MLLSTLFLLCGLVSAFLAANLHVNRNNTKEYPMYFMPMSMSSYWGVAIGLLIVLLVIGLLWSPFTDNKDHHHHDKHTHTTSSTRRLLAHDHVHYHHVHNTNNPNSAHHTHDDNFQFSTWIVIVLLLAIVSAIVFCSPMKQWYTSRMSTEQHYSTANFIKYVISGIIILIAVWVVIDTLGHESIDAVPFTVNNSKNTIWMRTETSSSSVVLMVWILFEALYLLWPYVHVTPDSNCDDVALYESAENSMQDTAEHNDALLQETNYTDNYPPTQELANQATMKSSVGSFSFKSSYKSNVASAQKYSKTFDAAFAPTFAPVITHEIAHATHHIHTPHVHKQRCELAFVSVYATFAMLAWPLITLLALAFDSKYELDIVVQEVLFGGIILGLLEYVRCTLLSVLDYSSHFVDCCWNAMTTLNCVLQLLLIFFQGFVYMILLNNGMYTSSDAAQQFVAVFFYVMVGFALLELAWYAMRSYGTDMSSMSLWEGFLAVYSCKLIIILLLTVLPLSVHNKDKVYLPILDSIKKTCADAHANPTTCSTADKLRSEFWMNATVVQNWPLEPWLCTSDVISKNVQEQFCNVK